MGKWQTTAEVLPLSDSETILSTANTLGTFTASSDIADGLKLDFTKDILTSTSDGVVTVITQKPIRDQSITPSISWRIPTITTNELPTGGTVVSSLSSGAGSLGSVRNSVYSSGSVSSVANIVTDTSSSSSSSIPTTTTHDNFYTTGDTSSSSSSSSSLAKTTTITHYYEDLTYTQVYVLTDKYTSLTTSLLATTSFYADQLSATYEISPPAITTDPASFKALFNVDPDMDGQPTMSKGTTAGISVGVIVGVLTLLISLGLWIRKKHPTWIPFTSKKSTNEFGDEEMGFRHILGKVNEDDPFNEDEYEMSETRRAPPPPPPLPPGSIQDDGEGSAYSTPEMTNLPMFEDSPEFSLFNMKSNFQSINNATIGSPPPLPPSRKSKSGNGTNSVNDQLVGLGSMLRDSSGESIIDNNKRFITPPLSPMYDQQRIGGPPDIREVLRGTPPPILDRSMGVVYESANEHDSMDNRMIKRSLHKRHNSDDVGKGGDLTELVIPYYKRRGPPSPLMINNFTNEENELESPKPIYDDNEWYRGRSGSVPKRYESLSESVHNLKQQLKKTDDVGKVPPVLPPPRKTNQVVDSFSVVRNSWGSSLSDADSSV